MIKKETDRFVTHPEYSRRTLAGKISAVLGKLISFQQRCENEF
jgi:hypothetical protein